jgi:Ca-activated chloride channel family protein
MPLLALALPACNLPLDGPPLHTSLNPGAGTPLDGVSVPPGDTSSPDGEGAAGEKGVSERDASDPVGSFVENDWVETDEDSEATFSIDVDHASYTRARGELLASALPAPGDVRVEEFVNYFHYGYPEPEAGATDPFEVFFEGAESPFGEGLHMLRLGIQAGRVGVKERPAANLVFLLDVSGSMGQSDKLPLLQESMLVLLDSLDERDSVGIVTYAGIERVALEPTPASDRGKIEAAIRGLTSGGSTNGEGGIRAAYELARGAAVPDGINRVILATDGDFNVGLTDEPLVQLVEKFADEGITLTGLLFGREGVDDAFMEELTNRGDGNYYHIDRKDEAVRVLSQNVIGTLTVVARDMKVQVHLNPKVVEAYRIVGYDNRVLADEDFANDFVDAGDLGASQSVTGLLEMKVAGGEHAADDVVAEVRIRYKSPASHESQLRTWPLRVSDLRGGTSELSPSMRLALGVAEFAEILRHSRHSEGDRFQDVIDLISDFAEGDGDVDELVRLVQRAQSLWPR